MRKFLVAAMAVAASLALPGVAGAAPYRGLWVTASDIQNASAPPSGVVSDANAAKSCTPSLNNQDDTCDTKTLAAALVYAKTGDTSYRDAVVRNVDNSRATYKAGTTRALALGRQLPSLVFAADVINLPAVDSAVNSRWVSFLQSAPTLATASGPSNLIDSHEKRPNNWGAMAGAALAAAYGYLGDNAGLDRTAKVERGWLGDRSQYAGFTYDSVSYSYGPDGTSSSNIVGVNPAGSTTQGHNTDGLQPDDQRRATGTTFAWPLTKATSYPWESLQGRYVAAVVLDHTGRSVWSASTSALRRAVDFLYRTTFNTGTNWPASGDDGFLVPIVNKVYGTSYTASSPSLAGKVAGYTSWITPSVGSVTPPPPPPADSDGDGVTDDVDQCPTVAGPASNNGCPLPVDNPPSAPTNLATSGVSQTAATLSWSAATDDNGVVSYQVTKDGVTVNGTTSLSYQFSGLTCGTTYTLGVRAVDTAGQYSTLATKTVTTSACSTTTQTQTLGASGDGYVDVDSPGVYFTDLGAMYVDGSPIRNSYVKFAVPSGITVKSAKLRLYNTASTSSTANAIATTSAAWHEFVSASDPGLTYNNAPAADGRFSGTIGSANAWNEATIPVSVVQAGQEVSFKITRTSSSRTDYVTKEGATTSQRPQLVITY